MTRVDKSFTFPPNLILNELQVILSPAQPRGQHHHRHRQYTDWTRTAVGGLGGVPYSYPQVTYRSVAREVPNAVKVVRPRETYPLVSIQMVGGQAKCR